MKQIVAGLPSTLDASIFIVWHMSADIRGILPEVLNKQQTIIAANATDNEVIVSNRIYVAPPDRHLMIDNGTVRVTHGPKENRFRPAVDPLFRSAAFAYKERAIGVILSGALDDGVAGLWAIKNYGGTSIVQDPADAQVSGMPLNAIRQVAVDYIVPASGIADLLTRLCNEPIKLSNNPAMEENDSKKNELKIALQDEHYTEKVMQFGELTPYTCPECHGVLSSIKEGNRERFRCHTGHAFSADTLLQTLTENIEHSLWSALRGIEESVMFLNHMGDHFSEVNQPHLAALYFKKANEASDRIKIIRRAILQHEELNADIIKDNADRINQLILS